MKIIRYTGDTSYPLTVDTTLITADNTNITVDATVVAGIPSYTHLKIIPREYPSTVYIQLYQELTEKNYYYIDSTPEVLNGYMTIKFLDTDIREGDSFELSIRSTDDHTSDETLIYRCKAYATNEEDLENYKLIPPLANGVIIV